MGVVVFISALFTSAPPTPILKHISFERQKCRLIPCVPDRGHVSAPLIVGIESPPYRRKLPNDKTHRILQLEEIPLNKVGLSIRAYGKKKNYVGHSRLQATVPPRPTSFSKNPRINWSITEIGSLQRPLQLLLKTRNAWKAYERPCFVVFKMFCVTRLLKNLISDVIHGQTRFSHKNHNSKSISLCV